MAINNQANGWKKIKKKEKKTQNRIVRKIKKKERR